MYNYTCTVDRVIDGDTVDVIVDYGFRLKQLQRIRLLRVDTPERGEDAYKEATQMLESLLKEAADASGNVRLTSYKTGKYGRWLGHLTSLDGIVDVNQVLHERWPNE
jgi:micrococcal nuclease